MKPGLCSRCSRRREAKSDKRAMLPVESREWRKLLRAAERYDEAVRHRPWRKQNHPKVALRRRLAAQQVLDQAEREGQDGR